ncbi:Crp/Fnr family transcriptional regulator [Aestuariibius sp. 2305UL40-4]|uniref:Crp/Fnr family transcriptional regulator n=1 Tax=Aestuariibius violaceus TaxID=3234132 RepID=UPI00345E6CF8
MPRFAHPDFAYTPLVTRLGYYMGVPAADISALDALPYREQRFDRGDVIIARGASINWVVLVTSGWAARSRNTRSGDRQIINILLPGDIVTPDVFVLHRLDHEIEALSTVTIRFLEKPDLQALLERAPGLATALWWAAAQEDSIVREHVVRLGRRNAIERIAHFLLEMHRRLMIVKQADEGAMILPLTQLEIADALGLSNVHVNKTLFKLEDLGHIRRQKTVTQLLNIPALAALCDFDTLYLHLEADQAVSQGTS